jgi:hypothetical protein
VSFTTNEKVKLFGCLDLWQHLMPEVCQKYKEVSYPKRKSLLDGIELLAVGDRNTFQLVANLHFMVPIIENVVQLGDVVEFTFDIDLHISVR